MIASRTASTACAMTSGEVASSPWYVWRFFTINLCACALRINIKLQTTKGVDRVAGTFCGYLSKSFE